MKTKLKTLVIGVIILNLAFIFSCKKDKDNTTDTVVQQIQTILPQKYIDSLKAHGLLLNEGSTPPIINGIYSVDPINDYDNSHVFNVGGDATNTKFKIANQSGTHADVYVKGWINIDDIDTSSAQIVAGTGNDFTVFAQAHGGNPVYIYDYILTGTYSAAGLKNLKFAFVVIDNGGNAAAAATSTIRIFHDKDNNASATTVFRPMLTESTHLKATGSSK